MWAIMGNICERVQGNLWVLCMEYLWMPNNMENIWAINMRNIYVSFKIMCGFMWVFCEWTNEIKARKFVPQHKAILSKTQLMSSYFPTIEIFQKSIFSQLRVYALSMKLRLMPSSFRFFFFCGQTIIFWIRVNILLQKLIINELVLALINFVNTELMNYYFLPQRNRWIFLHE